MLPPNGHATGTVGPCALAWPRARGADVADTFAAERRTRSKLPVVDDGITFAEGIWHGEAEPAGRRGARRSSRRAGVVRPRVHLRPAARLRKAPRQCDTPAQWLHECR